MTPKGVRDANKQKPRMVMMPDHLWEAGKTAAEDRGVSFSELVRRGMKREIDWENNKKSRNRMMGRYRD